MAKMDLPTSTVPDGEARSVGAADQNETTKGAERSSALKVELTDGPQKGETGNYQPAAYELRKNSKGQPVIREDR